MTEPQSDCYYALVWGNIEDDSGTIEGNIGRSFKNRLQMDVFPDGEYGKHAVTHFKSLKGLHMLHWFNVN